MTTGSTRQCQDQARALWYLAPRAAGIRSVALPPRAAGDLSIATRWSAVSRGTERLVFEGLHQPEHRQRMRAPLQEGEFPFPVKYGYCAVGEVLAGEVLAGEVLAGEIPAGGDLAGRPVFLLGPHQDRFVVPASSVVPVPEGVPPRRATLAANMETALNGVWDAGAGPGDRIAVVGAGLVGLLVAYLCASLPGAEVTAVDPDATREPVARALGAGFAASAEGIRDADVVFHTSAGAAGLAAALGCCGTEARLVELSWYGDREVSLSLGGAFHSRRISLVSSQVGMVAASRRPRWSHRRRLETALALLADPRLDALITGEVAFAELPAALPEILRPGAPGIATVVRYG